VSVIVCVCGDVCACCFLRWCVASVVDCAVCRTVRRTRTMCGSSSRERT
jgi:hypothetical protein